MVRIGIDAGRALHGCGGVASYTRQLIIGLARHAPGHELVVFDLDRGVHRREDFEQAIGGLPPSVASAKPSRDELATLDVFHAPGFVMPPAGASHHVFTLHDLTVISHPDFHTLDNRIRTMVSVAEALARGAVLIGVSRATLTEAVRLLSLSGDAVEVLPPILDARFTPAGNDELDEAALDRLGVRAPYCLAVASLEPRKNLNRLLDAWDLLPVALRDGHVLVIVASAGWLQGGLKERLRRLGRKGSVRSLKHLAGFDLAALYRRARLVVFPSLAEGFGLPVAEAMACGAPVVTSNVSSMPEVAGEAAVLVDPEDSDAIADGIRRVLESEVLRRDLRERGPERALQFSGELVVPRLLEIYHRTVQRSSV
jgi:glycosyltransferase involved in cell wall biosynthesis